MVRYDIHMPNKERENEPLGYQAARNAVHMKALYRSVMVVSTEPENERREEVNLQMACLPYAL